MKIIWLLTGIFFLLKNPCCIAVNPSQRPSDESGRACISFSSPFYGQSVGAEDGVGAADLPVRAIPVENREQQAKNLNEFALRCSLGIPPGGIPGLKNRKNVPFALRLQMTMATLTQRDFSLEQKAFEAFEKAADWENQDAQVSLAECYLNGKGVAVDQQKAIQLLQILVDQGVARAQVSLAECYLNGKGVAVDRQQAIRLFELAAGNGSSSAQYTLSLCYRKGWWGVTVDQRKGVQLRQLVAETGGLREKLASFGGDLPEKHCDLGLCYMNGWGMDIDYESAVVYFESAAKRKCAEAQYALGLCYMNGWGVDLDHRMAASYFQFAADQGWVEAQHALKIYCKVQSHGKIFVIRTGKSSYKLR